DRRKLQLSVEALTGQVFPLTEAGQNLGQRRIKLGGQDLVQATKHFQVLVILAQVVAKGRQRQGPVTQANDKGVSQAAGRGNLNHGSQSSGKLCLFHNFLSGRCPAPPEKGRKKRHFSRSSAKRNVPSRGLTHRFKGSVRLRTSQLGTRALP